MAKLYVLGSWVELGKSPSAVGVPHPLGQQRLVTISWWQWPREISVPTFTGSKAPTLHKNNNSRGRLNTDYNMGKNTMILSFVAVLAFVPAIVAAEQDGCCLCDSCNAVPLSKEEVILLHSDEFLGNTCGELELSLMDRNDVDTVECAAVRHNYEHVCCTEGFEGINMFDYEALLTRKGHDNKDEQQQAEASGQSTYLRAVRKLWQTSSWQYSRSSTTSTRRAPAPTFPGSTPQASSTTRYSSGSSQWSDSWSASGSSFSSSSNGAVAGSSSPSNAVTQQTGSQASSVSSTRASTTNTVSDGNVATTTSSTYASDVAVLQQSAVPCTFEPVGVSFSTLGGNFGFGICRDGSAPSAAAQGASIWDPNEEVMFSGDCHTIDGFSEY